MATVSARNSFGTYISYCPTTTGGTSKAPLMGLLNVTPPSHSKDVVDITNHGTTDGYFICIPTNLGKTGPVNISAIYLTSSSAYTSILLTGFENRTKGVMYFVIGGTSNMAQISMEGYVVKYGLTAPINDKVTIELSFKPTGTPSYATATTGY